MIRQKGDVFTSKAMFIGHGVNVDGVMGAGVAKIVRDKYPRVFNKYKAQCVTRALRPGQSFAVMENGKVIVNLATQDRPGANARYEWVFSSTLAAARKILAFAQANDEAEAVMAVPMIGAGIGGLDWPVVEKILETVEAIVPGFEFEVWEF